MISLWIVFFIGFFTGILAGFMGAGGGFILLPSLVYIIGCQTVVAVGTGLLGILFAGIYGCFSHSIKGNVDVLLAIIMLIISSIGAQVGASATKYVKGANLRLIFGFCVGWVSISVAFELIARLSGISMSRFLSQALLILIVVSLAFLIMVLPFKATSPSKFNVEKHSGQR